MKIAVPSLAPGRHTFESATPPSSYGELPAQFGIELAGDIAVVAQVNKMVDELFVRATVHAAARMECARCLKELEVSIDARFEALYLPDREHDMTGPAAHRAEAESQRVLYYSGGVADLGEQIIEALSLAAPMKPLCREDCKGICPSCGANLNEGTCGCGKGGDFNMPFKGLFGGARG